MTTSSQLALSTPIFLAGFVMEEFSLPTWQTVQEEAGRSPSAVQSRHLPTPSWEGLNTLSPSRITTISPSSPIRSLPANSAEPIEARSPTIVAFKILTAGNTHPTATLPTCPQTRQ